MFYSFYDLLANYIFDGYVPDGVAVGTLEVLSVLATGFIIVLPFIIVWWVIRRFL